jgi:hypothetical protein
MRDILKLIAECHTPIAAEWRLSRGGFASVHPPQVRFAVLSHFPSRQVKPLGLKMFLFFGRIFRVAK